MIWDVKHVGMINQHKVVELLARCQVEMATFGSYELALHWEQQALYVEHARRIVGAMSYEHRKHSRQTWICAAFVVPELRKHGIYRAMWDELVTRSRDKGMASIASGISPDNAPMICAAESAGRTPEFVCYRINL